MTPTGKAEGVERRLLIRAIKLFRSLADSHCGNTEGTPCNDVKPSYVCPHHKWMAEARRATRPERKGDM